MYLGRCSIRSSSSLGHHVLLGHHCINVIVLACLVVAHERVKRERRGGSWVEGREKEVKEKSKDREKDAR